MDTPAPRRRLPRLVLAAAVSVYLAYSAFGLCAPFYWGHHGYHGATYLLRARTSLRQRMVAPATWTGYDAPVKEALYFHHPIGYHHVYTVLIPIVGDGEWLARGVAALGGLLALWGLWAVGKRGWGEWGGALAVTSFVVLPIVTSFSILCDPMLPALACVLWSLWAYLELWEKPSWRLLLLHAALAYALGGFIMWEAYFIAPFVAIHALAGRFTQKGRALRLKLGRFDVNALDAHTLVTGAACVLMMAFHMLFTWKAGAMDDFFASYKLRHSAPSFSHVVDKHWQWITLLYGKAPVYGGAAWLVAFLGRSITGVARLRDLVPLTFLYVNTLYIYLFAEGSSVHLYRVFFYSGFFVFAVVGLAYDLWDAGEKLGARRAGGAAIGLGLVAWAFFVVPHGWKNLIESRAVMGTHGHSGYNPEREKLRFAAEVKKRTKPEERVILHYPHLSARKELWYYIDRSLDEVTELRQAERHKATWKKSVLVFDERLLSTAERSWVKTLIVKHPITFFDHFAMIDLRSEQPGAVSWAFKDGRMSPAYRYFVSHKYAPLELVRRAYLHGLCDVLEAGAPIDMNEEPPARPGLGDTRILGCYQQYMALKGDSAAVQSALADLSRGLSPADARVDRARVVAATVVGGTLRLVLHAEAPQPEGVELRYVVFGRNGLPRVFPASQIPPPHKWQPGFAYADSVMTGMVPGPWTLEVQLWRPPRRPTIEAPGELIGWARLGPYR